MSARGLQQLYSILQSYMKDGDWEELDHQLSQIDVAKEETIRLIAFLRYTFGGRMHLKEWDGLLERATREVTKRGENSRELFRGLSLRF